jgi:hypothetical protein
MNGCIYHENRWKPLNISGRVELLVSSAGGAIGPHLIWPLDARL